MSEMNVSCSHKIAFGYEERNTEKMVEKSSFLKPVLIKEKSLTLKDVAQQLPRARKSIHRQNAPQFPPKLLRLNQGSSSSLYCNLSDDEEDSIRLSFTEEENVSSTSSPPKLLRLNQGSSSSLYCNLSDDEEDSTRLFFIDEEKNSSSQSSITPKLLRFNRGSSSSLYCSLSKDEEDSTGLFSVDEENNSSISSLEKLWDRFSSFSTYASGHQAGSQGSTDCIVSLTQAQVVKRACVFELDTTSCDKCVASYKIRRTAPRSTTRRQGNVKTPGSASASRGRVNPRRRLPSRSGPRLKTIKTHEATMERCHSSNGITNREELRWASKISHMAERLQVLENYNSRMRGEITRMSNPNNNANVEANTAPSPRRQEVLQLSGVTVAATSVKKQTHSQWNRFVPTVLKSEHSGRYSVPELSHTIMPRCA
jgi:hypothetical protein